MLDVTVANAARVPQTSRMTTVRSSNRITQQQTAPVDTTRPAAPAEQPAPSPEAAPPAPAEEPARTAPTSQVLDETRAARAAQSNFAQAAWLGKAAQIAGGIVGGPIAGELARRAVESPRNEPAVQTPVAAAPQSPTTTAAAAPAAANTPPPLPAGSYDVGKVTPDELKAMRASKDPKIKATANTIANAQVAYKDQIAAGARVVVNNSEGNGGHPVLTLIPKDFDYSKPARVHTHYHGWSGTVADPAGHGAGTTLRMKEVQAKDPQTVFVLPECKNAPADASLKAPSYKTDWSNVTSQAQTTDDALKGSGITNVGKTVVSAHSGGGNALANAMNAHKDGSGVKADRLELQDCFYGSESSIAKWARTPNGQATSSVLYLHGTNDHSDSGVAQAFGKSKYKKIEMGAQGPITSTNNPPVLGDDGKQLVVNGQKKTKFNPDAHNRTVGQFMDSEPGP